MHQILQSPDEMSRSSKETVGVAGKTKFRHWFFDIGYNNAIVLSVYTLCLLFSISAPIVLIIGTLYFTVRYFIDKYNFIYIYPAEYESKRIARSSLVIYSLLAIVLF